MIIDFHTHIFPEEVRNNREAYFQDEPAFRLLYDSKHARLVGAGELVGFMTDQGVDRCVVFGFPWKNPDTARRHNDYIIETVEKFPEHLVGFGCFDPMIPGAANETRRCLENGLKGIGELAFYQNGISAQALKALAPVMETCRDKHVPVMLHVNEPVGHEYPGKSPNTLKQIHTLIKKFNHNRIVLAHWGGGIFFYHLLKKEMKECLKNVYFDTAASPFLYDIRIYKIAVEILGPDKVLFGSDWPLLPPSKYFKDLSKSGLDPDGLDKIRGLNARILLDLK